MKNLNFMGYPLYAVTRDGRVYSEISKRFLKCSLHQSQGNVCYTRVNLYNVSGVKTVAIHILVATAFVDNPHNYPVINHKDGDGTNNNDWNLEWCTHEHNTQHAVNTGLYKCRGLDLEVAHHIFSMMEEGYRNIDIADITGISYAVIGKMRQGENYREIWNQYDIPTRKHTLSIQKAEKIIKMLIEGLYVDHIAKQIEVSRSVVKDIRDGNRFNSLKKSLYKSATATENTSISSRIAIFIKVP